MPKKRKRVQLRGSLDELSASQSLEVNVNLICYHAKRQDAIELYQLQRTCGTLDLVYKDKTPVELLAIQGNENAVNFLMERYHASPLSAMRGYAFGYYKTQVNKLLTKFQDHPLYFSLWESMIRGYAEAGFVAAVQDSLSSVFNTLMYDRLRNIAIYRFAMRLSISAVDAMLADEKNPLQKEMLEKYAALGYAEIGAILSIEALLNKLNHPIIPISLRASLVYSYVINNDFINMQRLIDQVAGAEYILLAQAALRALAKQGEFQRFYDLIQKTPEDNKEYLIALAVAELGSVGEMETFSRLVSNTNGQRLLSLKKIMIHELAATNQMGHVKSLLNSEANPSRKFKLKCSAMKGFAKSGNINQILLFLNKSKSTARQNTLYGKALVTAAYHYQFTVTDALIAYDAKEGASGIILMQLGRRLSIPEINKLLDIEMRLHAGTDALRMHVIMGMVAGGHLPVEDQHLESLLSYFDDKPLRRLMLEDSTLPRGLRMGNQRDILNRVEKINSIMRAHNMSYDEALLWITVWKLPRDHHMVLLLSRSLAKAKNLPIELMLIIGSYVLGIHQTEIPALFESHQKIVPPKLYQASINNAAFLLFKLPKESVINEFTLAAERYRQRVVG